jgi:hypothetical protein
MCISAIITKHKLFALVNCQISVSQNMNSDQKENGHLTIPYLLHPGEYSVHDTGLVGKYQWQEFPVVITGKYRPGKYFKF